MSTYEGTKLELEALLDGGHTVADLLGMLAHICEEKRDWLLSGENGHAPDKPYAAAYHLAANKLTKCCASLEVPAIKRHRV